MKITKTPLEGLIVIEPHCFKDERGFFLESYQEKKYQAVGIKDKFVQDNHSYSVKGILRGMHYQIKRPQSQLVTLMSGKIYDVCVDLRPKSSTFGQWHGVTLSDQGPRQLYMAPGFAHGFCVLSDSVNLHYKTSRFYDPSDESGLFWNDPDVGIEWPLNEVHVSERDNDYQCLKDLLPEQFPHAPPIEKE